MTTHPRDWLDGYTLRLDDVAARAERVSIEVAAVTGTARSRDGAVTATASPAGALVGLSLGPPAESLGRERLAAEIVATAGAAQQAAAVRAVEVAEGLVGRDSAAMEVLRAAVSGVAR